MTRRFPSGFTLFVAAAVAAMTALGIWQLGRAEWKEELIGRLAANQALPATELPRSRAARDAASFRRVHVTCARTALRPGAGARAADGRVGYRQQLWCLPTAGGEPVMVSLGVATDPRLRIAVPHLARFTGSLVPRAGSPPEPLFLVIAESPVVPLTREATPTLATIPNSHRSYAVQWFAFALTLLIIYAVYLRGWRSARRTQR